MHALTGNALSHNAYRMKWLAAEIRRVRLALGMERQEDFARALDVKQSTVSRWENGAEPGLDALRRIVNLADEHDISTQIEVSADARHALDVEVVGEVQAGIWRETLEFPDPDKTFINLPDDPRYAGLPRFGLRVAGESMNELYPAGSILICVKLIDLLHGTDETDPRPGQRVIVQRKRLTGQVEATVKEYTVAADGRRWLVPRSSDPAFQTPIELAHGRTDDEDIEVLVTGLVIASYRLE